LKIQRIARDWDTTTRLDFEYFQPDFGFHPVLKIGCVESFAALFAFQTSGGTSTFPETFGGKVGECFEKTQRYPAHHALVCELKESRPLFEGSSAGGDYGHRAPRTHGKEDSKANSHAKVHVSFMRLEAHKSTRVKRGLPGGKRKCRVTPFAIDHYDAKGDMGAMTRCTAFPARSLGT
jgi:hypothetical protein